MKHFVFPFVLAAALSASDSGVAPGINSFTIDSYRRLAQGNTGLILSPFNIATALSMVLGGARGRTQNEIATVLHQHYDPSYDSTLAALLANLAKTGNIDGNKLLPANGLWVQKGFPIQPAFQKTLAWDYHAPLTPLEFVANAEGARGEINRWTEQHTKNKINNLLPAGSVSAQTRLVLTSAIYFYGKWQNPFLTSGTQPAPFTLESGATTQANFMHQTDRFGYTETPAAQVLEMRCAGTGMAFDVLLPKNPSGMRDLEKSLTSESLNQWLGNLTNRKIELALPKFRAESEFSLRNVLSAMGMPSAFSNNANFSGIDSQGGLAISEVVHKAFVEVSEQGAEAAAATGITIMPSSARRMPEETVVFRADHAFLFMIRDTQSGVILFIGRVTYPKA